jgi:hypothetical protein
MPGIFSMAEYLHYLVLNPPVSSGISVDSRKISEPFSGPIPPHNSKEQVDAGTHSQ